MRMHPLFCRINRGIVLGIIFVIGLIVYIMVDIARFNTEKGVIKDMIVTYAKEAEEFMIFPKELIKKGEKVPKDKIKEKYELNRDIDICT